MKKILASSYYSDDTLMSRLDKLITGLTELVVDTPRSQRIEDSKLKTPRAPNKKSGEDISPSKLSHSETSEFSVDMERDWLINGKGPL